MNQASELGRCARCNQECFRRCARCFGVFHCRTDHQQEDWMRHKCDCLPKLAGDTKQCLCSPVENLEAVKEGVQAVGEQLVKVDTPIQGGNLSASAKRRQRRNRIKRAKGEGSSGDINTQLSNSQCVGATAGSQKQSSVISSVVHDYRDINKDSAITYEGSSEQLILSESAQQLTTEFATPSSSNVLRTVNRTDVKMPILPNYISERKDYPEASLRGTAAPFGVSPNSYKLEPTDPHYDTCLRLVRDMTRYGICAMDNFIGREKGLLVLGEVLNMYRSGIFTAGQLVTSSRTSDARTIRSDSITWIDGREPHCVHIRNLIAEVDNIVLKANKMANNGKMGDYVINGRTKAMVACYPGGGSHYVKHVDNPNHDGRCITAIYYLNLDWDVRKCGGLLRVFPEGTNQVADIAPLFDRILFFWSDRRNPHEVQPAYNTRYAITLWYFNASERAEARRKFENALPSSSK